MKKTFTIFIIACLLGMANLQAQVANLEHQGTSSVYYGSSSFVDAYNASVDGDVIILSSGTFATSVHNSQLSIEKQIKIIGAGHYNDSIYSATYIDYLPLGNYTSNITIEGIKLGTLFVNNATNLTIRRCNILYTLGLYTGSCSNLCIEGSVLSGLAFNNLSNNVIIRNNIIYGIISRFSGTAIIENNILVTPYCSYSFTSINGAIINNNVIIVNYTWSCYGGISQYCSGNVFENNFVDTPSSNRFDPNTNTDLNNNYGVITTLYPNGLSSVFSYSTDYHIQNPTQYLGTDGTQIGIYGGSAPYKENAVPSNPRIVHKFIAPQGDADGNLQINIKVKAQNY